MNRFYKLFHFSKAKPTANNLNCLIPFSQNSIEYFHCNDKYECATTLGFSSCANGHFLAAYGNPAGTPFLTQSLFPSISLEKTGVYRLSVYVFFDCEAGEDLCENVQDFVKFYLNYDVGITDTAIFELKYSNFGKSKEWKRFDFEFISTSKQILVIFSAI